MKTQHTVNQQQYAEKSNNYLNSAVHENGAEFAKIKQVLQQNPSSDVLDLGCGAGHVSYHVAPYAKKVIAYDLSKEMVALVKNQAEKKEINNIETVQGSAEALPFADNSFDIVITRYSAHHWQNLAQAIDEVKRVLKSNGKLIVVDTISCNEPLFDTFIQAIELIRDPSHVRNYSLKEWIAIAEYAGFKTKNIEKQSIKLNLEVWTTRMHTPQESINTIRKLQMMACDQVKAYYEIDEVGNFQNYVGYLVFTH